MAKGVAPLYDLVGDLHGPHVGSQSDGRGCSHGGGVDEIGFGVMKVAKARIDIAKWRQMHTAGSGRRVARCVLSRRKMSYYVQAKLRSKAVETTVET